MSAGDQPFFPEGALIRQVQRERVVALSGARALFLQAAHPVAFVGFFSHSASLADPYPRLARTALAVNTVIYGSERQAREVQSIVGGMHARVQGRIPEAVGPFPAGTEFRGSDPALLQWILAAFIDSSYYAYERFVRPLSEPQREALWQQWRQVGEIFGIPSDVMPASHSEHRLYMEEMYVSGQLVVTPHARELAREVILNPPLPLALQGVKEAVNQFIVDSLPRDIQRQFGFLPLPGRGLATGAVARWLRHVGNPLAPDVVRYVSPAMMPAAGRDYAQIVALGDRRA